MNIENRNNGVKNSSQEVAEAVNKSSAKADRVIELSDAFLASAVKSAKGVLLMAKAVVEAKMLNAGDFTRFCKIIGYSEKSSSIRKLEAIGKKYQILAKNVRLLPNTWTTLYLLTKLTDTELTQAFVGGQIKPRTTAMDLSAAFPKLASQKHRGPTDISTARPKNVPNGTSEDELRIKLPSVPNDNQLAILREVLKWLHDEAIEVELGQRVSAALLNEDENPEEQELMQAA